MKYRVHVILDETYDDIEANSEDEAFIIASDFAMDGGNWWYEIEDVIEDDDDD